MDNRPVYPIPIFAERFCIHRSIENWYRLLGYSGMIRHFMCSLHDNKTQVFLYRDYLRSARNHEGKYIDKRPVRPIPIFSLNFSQQQLEINRYRSKGYTGKFAIIPLLGSTKDYAATFYKYVLRFWRALENAKNPYL